MRSETTLARFAAPVDPALFKNLILVDAREDYAAVMRDLVAARTAIHEQVAPHLAQDPVFVRSAIDIAYGRYNGCLTHFVPWLHRHYGFQTPQVLVEIGSGTGSTTAAFARMCGEIKGYDFDGDALAFAQTRLDRLGVTNARLVQVGPEGTLALIRRDFPDGIDGAILYAVLEHMTVGERIEMLSSLWEVLRPGGCILVGETPNRLSYLDHHTTGLPFFNMLNEELALRYYKRTERKDVVRAIEAAAMVDAASARMALVRSGYAGASFHEFELALGDRYASYIVSRPDDPEIAGVYGDHSAEVNALTGYVESKGLDIHPSFLEAYLLLILRKPTTIA